MKYSTFSSVMFSKYRAQMIKNPHALQGSGVQSLGQKAWLPTPVFLPGESHGQKSLVGYTPQGRKELEKFGSQLTLMEPAEPAVCRGGTSPPHWGCGWPYD